MKKNSIKESLTIYVSPSVIEVPFESEGILCQSTDVDHDGDHGGYGDGGIWDDDYWS